MRSLYIENHFNLSSGVSQSVRAPNSIWTRNFYLASLLLNLTLKYLKAGLQFNFKY